jgi:uncharacterized protein YydD (DUF2326 family)
MRLLKLSANKPTFHPLTFKEEGISIILGRKENSLPKNEKKTFNGLGKSLIIQIIHFCLGSNTIDAFEKRLPDWEFKLEFDVDGEKFIALRNTSKQSELILNDKEYNLEKFKTLLGEKVFKLKKPYINYLKFRPLISRFIRPRKESYMSYDDFVKKEEDYAQLVNNSYLLGLDVSKVSNKIKLKDKYDNIEDLKKSLEGDPIFKSYFIEDNDVDIDIVDLEESILHLSTELKNYRVAKDYDEIRREADDVSREVRGLKNNALILKNALKNIEKSLVVQPDISKEVILKLYNDAKVNFSEAVIKKLEDVQSFHTKLMSNRIERLMEERQKLEAQYNEIESKRFRLGQKEDELLNYLSSHGALDEYTVLSNKLSDLRSKFQKLISYKEILQRYKNKLEEIKIEASKENIDTNNYLNDSRALIDSNISLFRQFSKEFYEDKPGGIEITNNENLNKLRFNINAKIQDDASDGIGEVKIFCFDWTLLKARHNHTVRFIFHDSRLLSNMDPRQRATLFKLAYKNTVNQGLQYIVSANQDMLESMKEYFTEIEYKQIVEDNIVLELTDASNQTRLLGMQVDMDYESD